MSDAWPCPGYPLLPTALREAWKDDKLPPRVRLTVGLPEEWSLFQADATVWETATHPDRMDTLVKYLVSKVTAHVYYAPHNPVAQIPILVRPIMSILDLNSLPLSGRTKNSLRRSRRIGDQAWFTTATARDLMALRGLGPKSVLELSCVLERWRDLPFPTVPPEGPSDLSRAFKALTRWMRPGQ